jgi:Protein of unknown function (DUF2971)
MCVQYLRSASGHFRFLSAKNLSFMTNRKHDRQHFFKYATLQTGLRVIESKKFRWSAPAKFNDPFDHQVGFIAEIDEARFARLFTASLERIIFAEEEPDIVRSSLFTEMTLRLRKMRARLPRVEVLGELHKGSIQSAARQRAAMDTFNAQIQAQMNHARVFCVSERHDNVVMWSHYADEHRGVVFKLRCVDEIDNLLLAARKVDYTNAFLAFPGAEEFIKHLTGEEPIDLASLAWNIPYTKHLDWSYEKEWRVHMPLLGEPEGDGHSLYREDQRIFEALYLGCRVAETDLVRIAEHAEQYLPDMEIYRGERSKTSFALSFVKIRP